MSEIKIFVCHHGNKISELVDNPLYVHMRGDAALSSENPMGIAGDDTGDNISEKNERFNELTVQYWAWKNVRADYYGLCHYRRYLSFSEKRYEHFGKELVYEQYLRPKTERKYGLLDSAAQRALISGYDAVVGERVDIDRKGMTEGAEDTVLKMWESNHGQLIDKSVLPILSGIVDELAPQYSASMRSYLAGRTNWGYNCYILKKELFEALCAFEFPVLLEFDRRVDTTGYTGQLLRTTGFMGELLFGIFVHHIIHCGQWRVKELQTVLFLDTRPITGKADLLMRNIRLGLTWGPWVVVDALFPMGSKRRERVKSVIHRVAHIQKPAQL